MVAVAFVATALCAERLAVAAPSVSPQVIQAARQLATRLAGRFSQSVPTMRLERSSREARQAPAVMPARPIVTAIPHPAEFSPSLFRLPPPLV